MQTLLLVFIGGGLGSLARFGISKAITSNFSTVNPIATLISNITATAILGSIVLILSNKGVVSNNLKALIVIGFCGGFSTFSTFSFETFELLRSGHYIFALINISVSLIIGVGVLFLITKII